MATDLWGVDEPEWYRQLQASTPEGENPEYVKIGLDEFCGRFDLTPGTAKAEIRRCKLLNCGVSPLRVFKMPHERGQDDFKIPLPEADRYAAIIAAEKQQSEPPQKKKHRNPDNPKSQHTLLQMIAVMAIKGYKYNPGDDRSTVPATIVNSAQSMGIVLDQKTVRGWLQQATAECLEE